MADNGNAGKGVAVVSILLAALFLVNGGMKLFGMMVDQFAMWGYPAWFQYLIGAVEAVAGVGFLRRSTRFAAAVVVIPIMAGAIFTLLRAGAAAQAAVPAVTLVLALCVLKKAR